MLEDIDGEYLSAFRRVVAGWFGPASDSTLLLARRDVAAQMETGHWLEAVTAGFRAVAEGKAAIPFPLAVDGAGGAFHAKAARLDLDRSYVALKLNSNFPDNRDRHRLPTIQGAILLFDGETGGLLAIMDSIEVTLRRTAAASALAAQFLARPESSNILICGCGDQAAAQLEALRAVLPLRQGHCWDRDRHRAAQFASRCIASGFPMVAVRALREAAPQSDVIVTCTSARSPFLGQAMVRPGTFVAAVGADSPGKSEIHPELVARSTIVVDSLEQCSMMGDLNHALSAGLVGKEGVHAELSEIVAGRKGGRTGEREICLFDSTGTAVQDAASAAAIYRRALKSGCGRRAFLAR